MFLQPFFLGVALVLLCEVVNSNANRLYLGMNQLWNKKVPVRKLDFLFSVLNFVLHLHLIAT
jgi:hypothetical protein